MVPGPDGKPKPAELFEAWRRSPLRREYKSVEFARALRWLADTLNTLAGLERVRHRLTVQAATNSSTSFSGLSATATPGISAG